MILVHVLLLVFLGFSWDFFSMFFNEWIEAHGSPENQNRNASEAHVGGRCQDQIRLFSKTNS